VAVIDVQSRKILSRRLSNMLDARFYVNALEEAFTTYGKPDIFNTDQGSQFTGWGFIGILKRENLQISMDGKGSWVDNVFIERLWRSVKYEDVYLRAYEDIRTARFARAIFSVLQYWKTTSILDWQTPHNAYYRPVAKMAT
jgi:putative transposase